MSIPQSPKSPICKEEDKWSFPETFIWFIYFKSNMKLFFYIRATDVPKFLSPHAVFNLFTKNWRVSKKLCAVFPLPVIWKLFSSKDSPRESKNGIHMVINWHCSRDVQCNLYNFYWLIAAVGGLVEKQDSAEWNVVAW